MNSVIAIAAFVTVVASERDLDCLNNATKSLPGGNCSVILGVSINGATIPRIENCTTQEQRDDCCFSCAYLDVYSNNGVAPPGAPYSYAIATLQEKEKADDQSDNGVYYAACGTLHRIFQQTNTRCGDDERLFLWIHVCISGCSIWTRRLPVPSPKHKISDSVTNRVTNGRISRSVHWENLCARLSAAR